MTLHELTTAVAMLDRWDALALIGLAVFARFYVAEAAKRRRAK